MKELLGELHTQHLGKCLIAAQALWPWRHEHLHFTRHCVRTYTHADNSHKLLGWPSVLFSDVNIVTCLEDLPVVMPVGDTVESVSSLWAPWECVAIRVTAGGGCSSLGLSPSCVGRGGWGECEMKEVGLLSCCLECVFSVLSDNPGPYLRASEGLWMKWEAIGPWFICPVTRRLSVCIHKGRMSLWRFVCLGGKMVEGQ
jgi:hypothetical protein